MASASAARSSGRRLPILFDDDKSRALIRGCSRSTSPRFLPAVSKYRQPAMPIVSTMTNTIETHTATTTTDTDAAAIAVVGVSRHARGRQLLHGISLSISPGELVAVVGPSG